MTPPGSVEGDERVRLFCGLRLSDETLERVGAWQAEQLRDGRIVPREHLHVTLAFLGSTPAAAIPAIASALAEAARDAGEIVFTARRYRETRSVGMLVLDDATGESDLLAGRLFDGLEALGVYEREKRPWLPHITVLRFRQPPRLAPPVPDLGTFNPSDAAVYHSRLRPTGAQYVVLETIALGG